MLFQFFYKCVSVDKENQLFFKDVFDGYEKGIKDKTIERLNFVINNLELPEELPEVPEELPELEPEYINLNYYDSDDENIMRHQNIFGMRTEH